MVWVGGLTVRIWVEGWEVPPWVRRVRYGFPAGLLAPPPARTCGYIGHQLVRYE